MLTEKNEVIERFIRYAETDTQSAPDVEAIPSTDKQKKLALMLFEELKEMGASDVFVDEYCCVYAKIPSNIDNFSGKAVGFLAHIDTSPDAESENIKPWVLRNYQGGDIILNSELNIVMYEKTYPRLLKYIGDDLILTDGTTLLGGDDKAAITSIMETAKYFLTNPDVKHGTIVIGFTCDEEVGLGGASVIDLERLGADVAYTLDGDGLGGFYFESFNAEEAQFTIHGINVHPGTAKGIMVNAVEIGSELISMLPAFERPQYTCDREGFYHPLSFEGTVEQSFIRCIIRDHEPELLTARHNYVCKVVDRLNEIYGVGTVEVEFTNGYKSMREEIKKVPYLIEYALEAYRDCGVEPDVYAMRGGTDGSMLSQRGLPCPNITAGYENAHGRFEYVSVQSMMKNVEILVRLNEIFAERM